MSDDTLIQNNPAFTQPKTLYDLLNIADMEGYTLRNVYGLTVGGEGNGATASVNGSSANCFVTNDEVILQKVLSVIPRGGAEVVRFQAYVNMDEKCAYLIRGMSDELRRQSLRVDFLSGEEVDRKLRHTTHWFRWSDDPWFVH